MGIKDFFRKIGRGIRSAGRWIRDRALPAIGRFVKPVLSTIGLLPGKIGTIGRVGGAIAGALHDGINNIPNKEVRDKLNNAVARGNEAVQGAVDRGRGVAEGANTAIGVGRDVVDKLKEGLKQIRPTLAPPVLAKPAVPPVKINRPM